MYLNLLPKGLNLNHYIMCNEIIMTLQDVHKINYYDF